MAGPSSKPENALRLLADLKASQNLIDRLEATAPETCKTHGGAQHLLARYGHLTGAGYWGLNLSAHDPAAVSLWEAMAHENRPRPT